MASLGSKARGWLQDMRVQGLVLLALALVLLLLQCSISWALLCLCELVLFRFVPQRRAWVDMALVVLPCILFLAYLLFASVQGGINGDVAADMFFMVVAVALVVSQRYATQKEEVLELPQGQEVPRRPSNSQCCCACCSCCGVLLCISLLAQAVGMMVYLANTPRPSYTATSIAYWCEGEPNNSLVVLEPGYLASPGSLFHVQKVLSQSTRVCTYDPVGTGFSDGHNPSFQTDALAMKDPSMQ